MSFLGGSEPEIDPADAFVPARVPDPGAFVAEHEVLAGLEFGEISIEAVSDPAIGET
ncbi:hypothetical protein [Halorubrum trueperi]|uniref:Uncharacterized protein n=1 Tax=Halorubrum trueperi TaxID=2004704 RepID=A0ABD5UQ26_9EURY